MHELIQWWRAASLKPAKTWAKVKGPLHAVQLELERIKWTWPSPTTFKDHEDHEIQLHRHSYKEVEKLLERAWFLSLEHKMGATLEGGRATMAHVTQQLRSKAYPSEQKGILTCWTTGGWWTRDRMAKAGYMVEPSCQCGLPDSLHHRLWTCSVTQALRLKAMTPADCEWGSKEDCPSTSRAWRKHPAECWPGIAEGFEAFCWSKGEDGLWSPTPSEQFEMSRDFFADGSYKKGLHGGMGRAAWAAGVASKDGTLNKVVVGRVPKGIRQLPITAEWMATSVACQYLVAPSRLHLDCSAVVQEVSKWLATKRVPNSLHAGFIKFLASETPASKWVQEVVKVKAHQTSKASDSPDLARVIEANSQVDIRAKAGLLLHDQPSAAETASLAKEEERAARFLKYAPEALMMFDRIDKVQGRQPPGVRTKTSRLINCKHKFALVQAGWQCLTCQVLVTNCKQLKRRLLQECPGHSVILKGLMLSPKGHSLLWSTSQQQPLVICTSCGAYATKRAAKLAEACLAQATPAGLTALKHFRAGWHPLKKHRLDSNIWRISSEGVAEQVTQY